MLKSSNDMTSGQQFTVKVAKRPDGTFEATCESAPKLKATAKTQIIGTTTTPTGEPGFIAECTCATHKTGTRIIVREEWRPGFTANPALIHGHVVLAYHPALSRAPQIRTNGPWAA